MRVSTNMIFDRKFFNPSRNIDRYMHAESMLSSGRRINAPSDDPVGAHHDLSYRTRLGAINGCGLDHSVTRMLSEVEDADLVSLVSELAREENLYRAALAAGSGITQQSLVDFLR